MDRVLEIKNLSLHYKQDEKIVQVLNKVSLSISEGEAFGIVGESGCGKSTLAKAIIRLLSENAVVDQGEILYRGNDIMRMDKEQLRNIRGSQIGMIFQNPMTALNPTMKLRDQIYEVLREQGYSKEDMKKRAVELFRMVGISAPEKRLNEYIHQYSGGMRQRAMIAIVLAANPKVLIADEPTTALDVTIQKQIIGLLKRLRKKLKMTLILITHDLGVVSELCDQVAVMYAGQLVEVGSKHHIFSNPHHTYTKGLLNSLPRENDTRERLEAIQGMPPSLIQNEKDKGRVLLGCAFAQRCKYVKENCKTVQPKLRKIEVGHFSACVLEDKEQDE